MNDSDKPIIIKKVKKGGGGHHGGAWKVAYADFVTAMMAFFLLLWLLNVTTDDQKKGLSNYFNNTPANVSDQKSGAGGVLGGLSVSPEGAMATQVQSTADNPPTIRSPRVEKKEIKGRNRPEKLVRAKSAKEKAIEERRKEEQQKFDETKNKIKDAISNDPDLKELSKNLVIDMTPEGLRVQIIDEEGRAMFASGSTRMFQKMEYLLTKVGQIIQDTTANELSIRGHTDSVPYGEGAEYTNWELSSDRANATRRVLLDTQFPAERINNVMGMADTQHLLPDDPKNERNRRISIILLKEELTDPNYDKKVEADAEQYVDDEVPTGEEVITPEEDLPPPPVTIFRRTQGEVQFP